MTKVVTIDGPSGVGKGTISEYLSEKVLIDLKKYLPKTKKGPWTDKKKLF